jgi:hypothetical protein
VRLAGSLGVLGGPDYEVNYPNGDRVADATAVYEAWIIDGVPGTGDGELSGFAWFAAADPGGLSRFARALLRDTAVFDLSWGRLGSNRRRGLLICEFAVDMG